MDRLNPIDILIAIVIKGIILGAILAVAWPTKCLIDAGAKFIYTKTRDAIKPVTIMKVKKSEV